KSQNVGGQPGAMSAAAPLPIEDGLGPNSYRVDASRGNGVSLTIASCTTMGIIYLLRKVPNKETMSPNAHPTLQLSLAQAAGAWLPHSYFLHHDGTDKPREPRSDHCCRCTTVEFKNDASANTRPLDSRLQAAGTCVFHDCFSNGYIHERSALQEAPKQR